jgi:hypothetical protein
MWCQAEIWGQSCKIFYTLRHFQKTGPNKCLNASTENNFYYIFRVNTLITSEIIYLLEIKGTYNIGSKHGWSGRVLACCFIGLPFDSQQGKNCEDLYIVYTNQRHNLSASSCFYHLPFYHTVNKCGKSENNLD